MTVGLGWAGLGWPAESRWLERPAKQIFGLWPLAQKVKLLAPVGLDLDFTVIHARIRLFFSRFGSPEPDFLGAARQVRTGSSFSHRLLLRALAPPSRTGATPAHGARYRPDPDFNLTNCISTPTSIRTKIPLRYSPLSEYIYNIYVYPYIYLPAGISDSGLRRMTYSKQYIKFSIQFALSDSEFLRCTSESISITPSARIG